MKNNKKIVIQILIFSLFVSSCTQVLYTHKDYMERYSTKSSVISGFGLPTEKRIEGDIEEWYYNFGTNTIVNTYNAPLYNNSRIGIGNAQTYSKYVKFTFRNDYVANWYSQGVDYTEREIKKTKTIIYIISCLGFGVLLGIATSQ